MRVIAEPVEALPRRSHKEVMEEIWREQDERGYVRKAKEEIDEYLREIRGYGMSKLRIYLDASPVIYMVECVERYFDYLEMRLFVPDDTLVASELTRLETRVKPI